jgi:hypothetical protein
MYTNIDHILVLKTNIRFASDRQKVSILLDTHKEILQWNLDRHDIDCMRIISSTLTYNDIIEMLQQQGFDASALD